MILIIEDIKLMIYVPPENGFAEGYSKQFIIINVFLCIELIQKMLEYLLQ